jgi:1,6-anhydro-N-acetylmuramate kinase
VRPPVFETALWWMVLDEFEAPAWAWLAWATVFGLLTLACLNERRED